MHLARKISDFDTIYLSVKALNSDDDNNNKLIEKEYMHIVITLQELIRYHLTNLSLANALVCFDREFISIRL